MELFLLVNFCAVSEAGCPIIDRIEDHESMPGTNTPEIIQIKRCLIN
ncbi:MAG: hypothetical protein GXP14_02255 [Gammaproteobacteria bacterium]|nr:hypothetical protein [Gammaproteobacteria bacterium]